MHHHAWLSPLLPFFDSSDPGFVLDVSMLSARKGKMKVGVSPNEVRAAA